MSETAEPAGSPAHRRRRRSIARQGPPPARPEPAETPAPEPDPPAKRAAGKARPAKRPKRPREPGERGLRELVGSGASQLGVSGALRGRDVNRPTDEDLTEAEQTVAIVRRNWRPPPE
jgi:hypothetical protein